MEKYEAPAADAAAEGEADAEPAEAVEEGADANAKLHIETSEALKDIIEAALQVSGLQVYSGAVASPHCPLSFDLFMKPVRFFLCHTVCLLAW